MPRCQICCFDIVHRVDGIFYQDQELITSSWCYDKEQELKLQLDIYFQLVHNKSWLPTTIRYAYIQFTFKCHPRYHHRNSFKPKATETDSPGGCVDESGTSICPHLLPFKFFSCTWFKLLHLYHMQHPHYVVLKWSRMRVKETVSLSVSTLIVGTIIIITVYTCSFLLGCDLYKT